MAPKELNARIRNASPIPRRHYGDFETRRLRADIALMVEGDNLKDMCSDRTVVKGNTVSEVSTLQGFRPSR